MIKVEQLSKSYGPREAIKNLSFQIEKGEVVGYAVIQLEGESLTTIKLHSTEDISEGSFYRKTLDSILRSF